MDPGGRYSQIPIPSYEEATSSRPTSSSQYRGPQEVSDDAERQGLLHESNQSGYQPPTVESARSSVDSDLQLPEVNGEDDRRQIEELDYLDPEQDANGRGGIYHRARLRSQLSKRLANISATFSSLRLPFRSLYSPVATGDTNTAPTTPSDSRPRRPWLPQLSNPWHSVPEQYRLSAPTFARLCGLFTIVALIYILFALDMLPNGARQIGRNFDPESVRQFVQENIDPSNIQEFLKHITSYDHVAGTEGDLYLAKWMEGIWLDGGMDDMAMWEYWVYMNYPTKDGRSVKIVKPEGKKWTAKLEEEQVDDTKTQTWAWHGHSKSGEATGSLVFANKGRREDLQWLKDHGVETKGCIALIRYAPDMLPGLQIKAAEEAGCVGALLYSDAAGDVDVWPDSGLRPPDSVQRADVAVSNWVLGDPLTPGRASRQNARREDVGGNPALPQIPSLPLSWRDAKTLINSLQDVGVKVPDDWVGNNAGSHWYSGASDEKAAVVVELRNNNDESTKQRIYNLHAVIQGLEQPNKKLIVGARRDAWCFGSATGTAILMEVAKIFVELRKLQWRPLRTIEFVSWDAGMFGAVGATEWVEDRVGDLRDNGLAYLNVDAGVFGTDFMAEGSPLLRKALMHVLGRVTDPGRNDTLKHIFYNKHGGQGLHGLSSSNEPSDALPFQSLAGTSVLDFGFKRDDPDAYPRGSCYETYDWMQKFGDNSEFEYHRTLAQIWALLILEIADRPLIPFDLKSYAQTITTAVNDLEKFAIQTYTDLNPKQSHPLSPAELKKLTDNTFDLTHLHAAASMLQTATREFHTFEDSWTTVVMADGGLEMTQWAFKRLDYNNKISHFETDLLDLAWDSGDEGQHGIPAREQFKHVLWGPRAWGKAEPFPGVRDAIESGDWKLAQRLAERAARVIRRAGNQLWEDPGCEGEWCDG